MYLVELFEGKLLINRYLTKYELKAQAEVRKWELKDNNTGRYEFVAEKI